MTEPCDTDGATTPTMVLDTNAVLDLLAFRDPRSDAIRLALEAGNCRLLASAHMRQELVMVLARSTLARFKSSAADLVGRFDELVQYLPAPTHTHPVLRCRDRDDQIFIDFALAYQVRWLVSHDRDLLTLARRARRMGLSIVAPPSWRSSDSQETASGIKPLI